jgi:hypothetical protein
MTLHLLTLALDRDSAVDLKLDELPLSRVSLYLPFLKSISLPPPVLALDLILRLERLRIPHSRQTPKPHEMFQW